VLEPGTIILDTVCLSESAGRKTPKDEAIIAKLQALQPSLDRHRIFSELLAIKHNDTASNVKRHSFFCIFYFRLLYFIVLWVFYLCIDVNVNYFVVTSWTAIFAISDLYVVDAYLIFCRITLKHLVVTSIIITMWMRCCQNLVLLYLEYW